MLRPLMCVVSVAVLSIASSACATQGAYSRRYPAPVASVDQRAYTHAYDEGRSAGSNDARRNRRYDYSRYSEYRDADDGYRGYGDRNAYRTLYRDQILPIKVAELLILERRMPRSLVTCFDQVNQALSHVNGRNDAAAKRLTG